MPLKRNEELKSLSREHHHGLLLCWKIKTGFSKGVSVDRIKSYTDWFYTNHLLPHFEIEEKYVFPILGASNPNISKALEDHRNLKKLFTTDKDPTTALKQIETELENHIRFEERILFGEIQLAATAEQLKVIQANTPPDSFSEVGCDLFWN